MNNIEFKKDFTVGHKDIIVLVAALLYKILHIYLTAQGNNKAIDKFDNLV